MKEKGWLGSEYSLFRLEDLALFDWGLRVSSKMSYLTIEKAGKHTGFDQYDLTGGKHSCSLSICQ